jgi:hypothetical protein
VGQDGGDHRPLDRGEPAGGQQGERQDGDADPDDEQPGAEAQPGDDDDERAFGGPGRRPFRTVGALW